MICFECQQPIYRDTDDWSRAEYINGDGKSIEVSVHKDCVDEEVASE